MHYSSSNKDFQEILRRELHENSNIKSKNSQSFSRSQNSTKTPIKAKDNTRLDSIKIAIRIRPLLDYEDINFWECDTFNNTINTIK